MRAALLLLVGAALLVSATGAAARPERGSIGGYQIDALVCTHDADARVRVSWSDTPGDPDAPADVDGSCFTVPPWIQVISEAAVHALDVAVSLGFPLPPGDGRRGGDARYDVYVLDLGSRDAGLLGYAETDGGGPSSSLLVDESYVDELPVDYPTPPEDALRVTVAHELFHGIQFGMGVSPVPLWILEGTAVWFEAQAEPSIPDNVGYLVRHLTGERGRLPLWTDGMCEPTCWLPGLPHDPVHVYASWLFLLSAADERGDRDFVRRLLLRLASTPPVGDYGLGALHAVAGGDLAVRLREYGLGLLLRRRIGTHLVPAALAEGPEREPMAQPARPATGRLWPLQPLLVPIDADGTAGEVTVRTAPIRAPRLRRGVALVAGDGTVLRLPRIRDDRLVFDLPASPNPATVILTSAQRVWPLTFQVTVRRIVTPDARFGTGRTP